MTDDPLIVVERRDAVAELILNRPHRRNSLILDMLDYLHAYVEGGGRLMYMGANGFYWVINYDPENKNVIEVRKGHGSNAWRCRPGEFHLSFTGEYGTLWRHRGRAPQRLVGVGFGAEGFDETLGVGDVAAMPCWHAHTIEAAEDTVVFRVSDNTWLEVIVRYLVHPKEAGRTKTRLIKRLLTELNAAPDRVLFPKSSAR